MEDLGWLVTAIQNDVKEGCARATAKNDASWLSMVAFVPEHFWAAIVDLLPSDRQEPSTTCKTDAQGTVNQVSKWKLRAQDLHPILGAWERTSHEKTYGGDTVVVRIGVVRDQKPGDVSATWCRQSLRLTLRWWLLMFNPSGHITGRTSVVSNLNSHLLVLQVQVLVHVNLHSCLHSQTLADIHLASGAVVVRPLPLTSKWRLLPLARSARRRRRRYVIRVMPCARLHRFNKLVMHAPPGGLAVGRPRLPAWSHEERYEVVNGQFGLSQDSLGDSEEALDCNALLLESLGT